MPCQSCRCPTLLFGKGLLPSGQPELLVEPPDVLLELCPLLCAACCGDPVFEASSLPCNIQIATAELAFESEPLSCEADVRLLPLTGHRCLPTVIAGETALLQAEPPLVLKLRFSLIDLPQPDLRRRVAQSRQCREVGPLRVGDELLPFQRRRSAEVSGRKLSGLLPCGRLFSERAFELRLLLGTSGLLVLQVQVVLAPGLLIVPVIDVLTTGPLCVHLGNLGPQLLRLLFVVAGLRL